MSVVRWIADLHFRHKNMAIKRGFKSEFEHDEHIIRKWNNVVNKKDTTYILGDLTMESPKFYPLLERLNGRKKVIMGNHEMLKDCYELLDYVDQIGGMEKYSRKGYPKIFLTHCPIHPSELEHRVGINIHGHIHENFVMKSKYLFFKVPDPRYICVSCEHVDYTPRTLEELLGPSKYNI